MGSNMPSHADSGRVARPLTLSAALGYPAPSFVGGAFGYQFAEYFQFHFGTGMFWTEELKIQTLSGELRFHALPFRLTPMLGAGVSKFFLHGRGKIQGLESSTALGSLMAGLDWSVTDQWRFSGGLQFHYPVKLIYPFIELGWMF